MRNESTIAANSSSEPVFFMREGVHDRWTPINASMTQRGYAATLESAKAAAARAAFWSLSPLYVGKRASDGSMQIVSLMRWEEREKGEWIDGSEAHQFEIDGKL